MVQSQPNFAQSTVRIRGAVQHYAWGTPAATSLVAAVSKAQQEDKSETSGYSGDKPCAELWLGAHPSAPAEVSFLNRSVESVKTKTQDVSKPPRADSKEQAASESIVVGDANADGPSVEADKESQHKPPSTEEVTMDKPLAANLAEWLNERGVTMPYLLKILSIAKPLSLQLHPDIQNAEKLHKEFPDIYKDPNDKPEMAFVVSKTFKLMCGFRKAKEISAFVELLPALSFLLNADGGEEDADSTPADGVKKSNKHKTDGESATLKLIMKNLYGATSDQIRGVIEEVRESFEAHFEKPETTLTDSAPASAHDDSQSGPIAGEKKDLSTATAALGAKSMAGVAALGGMFESVVKSLKGLVTDDQKQETKNKMTEAYRIFEWLNKEYPGDRGVLAPFILNCAELRSGDCISIKPNTIHAYISGDCLECMKSSDNVIRAGLTPKFQDVSKLLELVEYKPTSISSCMVKGQDVSFTCQPKNMTSSRVQCKAIIPNITDAFRFYILRITKSQNDTVNVQIPQWAPAVCVVLKGKAEVVVEEVNDDNGGEVKTELSAGESLAITSWQNITARNLLGVIVHDMHKTNEKSPSNNSFTSHSQLLHSCELTVNDFTTEAADEQQDLLMLFVTPNNDLSVRKRPSKEFKSSVTGITNAAPIKNAARLLSFRSPRKPSVTQSTLIESTG